MGFDLGEFKRSTMDIAEIEITHPATGLPLDLKISVLSPDSNEYRKIALQQQNDNIKNVRKNRGRKTAEKIAEEGMDLLVAITMGWDGMEENGEPVPFTPENVRRVYEQFPFIKEQVDEFAADRRNFIKS